MQLKSILELLKSFQGLIASLGAIVPGYTFFTNNCPPLFAHISIITSALAVAVIISVSQSQRQLSSRKSISILILAFLIVIGYMIFLDFSTIEIDDTQRWQIGFGTMDFGLTPVGQKMIAGDQCPGSNYEDILMCAGFMRENIELIWKRDMVYLAGTTLIILFTLSSLLWTYGWVHLAKIQLTKTQSNDQ